MALSRRRPLLLPSPRSDIINANKSWRPGGKYGLSLRHSSTSSTVRTYLTQAAAAELDAVCPIGSAGSVGFTCLVAWRPTSVVGNHTFGIDTGTTSVDMFLLLPWTDNFIYFEYGGTQAKLTATGLTFGDDLWCGTAGLRGVELWQNGILRVSTATVPARSSANAPLVWSAWTQGFGPLGDCAFIMTWRRQLHPAAIQSLFVNPWQVFQPPVSLSWSLEAPAAGATPTFPALMLAP